MEEEAGQAGSHQVTDQVDGPHVGVDLGQSGGVLLTQDNNPVLLHRDPGRHRGEVGEGVEQDGRGRDAECDGGAGRQDLLGTQHISYILLAMQCTAHWKPRRTKVEKNYFP